MTHVWRLLAIKLNAGIILRYAKAGTEGTVLLRSENGKDAIQELPEKDVEVLGEVVWCGRKLVKS